MKGNARNWGEDLGGIWDSALSRTAGISSEALGIGFRMEDQELGRISKHTRVCKFSL